MGFGALTVRTMRSLIAVSVMVAAPAIASAQNITFTHTGTIGTGSIGTTNFVRRDFSIVATGNTASRQAFVGGFWIDHLAASINIDGVGLFNFTTGTRTFVNNGNSLVGFSRAGTDGLDLFNGPTNAAFAGCNMLSSIGQFGGEARLVQWSNTPVETSGGTLAFNNLVTTGTFQAVVGTTVVPEPSTYSLLAVAMSAMAMVLRRRAGRSTGA